MVKDPVVEPTHYPITVEMFLKMGEVGLFAEEARLELIEGEILEMSPMGPKHARALSRLSRRLQKFDQEVYVWSQCPVQFSNKSLPMPDIALLRLPQDEASENHPQLEEVLLIVEVADSSLEFDRKKKLSIYAKAAIPEYWIVNLVDKQLEAYQQPMGKKYRSQTLYDPGQTVQALCLSRAIQWD